jgi:hypothetical protein
MWRKVCCAAPAGVGSCKRTSAEGSEGKVLHAQQKAWVRSRWHVMTLAIRPLRHEARCLYVLWKRVS